MDIDTLKGQTCALPLSFQVKRGLQQSEFTEFPHNLPGRCIACDAIHFEAHVTRLSTYAVQKDEVLIKVERASLGRASTRKHRILANVQDNHTVAFF